MMKLKVLKIYLFVVSNIELDKEIEEMIISTFGSFALPKNIFYVSQIPKTRSGKILRRLLRDILKNPNQKKFWRYEYNFKFKQFKRNWKYSEVKCQK